MSTVKAIANHIIFRFESEIERRTVEGKSIGHFVETTDWGFKMVSTEETTQNARWARVIATGPKCNEDIQPGMRILIQPLQWTNGVEFEGEMYWRTNDQEVMLIDDDFNAVEKTS